MNTKKQILTIIFIVSTLCLKSQNNKFAFVIPETDTTQYSDDDEIAALSWFRTKFPENGTVITINDISNNLVNVNSFNVLWIHVDQENTNGELPSSLLNQQLILKISDYLKNGGNLLLTNHASQFIYELGRISKKPNFIHAGSAINNTDLWTINPNIGLTYNYIAHPVYSGISGTNIFGYATYRMISSGLKENHNCIWDLRSFNYNGNKINQFEKETVSRVIGTWGNDISFDYAGIVEFLPNDVYKGKCIAIGIGAYEWSQNDKLNPYQANIQKLTENTLNYLSLKTQSNVRNKLVSNFSMELNNTKTSVQELVANRTFIVDNAKPIRENIPGAEGNALRFDGFSTFIKGRFNATELSDSSFSGYIWIAPESYPMMNNDGWDETNTFIAGNMNTTTGFAFTLNANGKYGFEVFIDSVKIKCYANHSLPKYSWNKLAFNVSLSQKEIQLYNNGEIVSKTYFNGNQVNSGSGVIFIGKSADERWTGPFRLNTINGLIDDFKIFSGETNFNNNFIEPENKADLKIPESRFANEIQRPLFHGQPGANWTNEPHGLVYYNNKYHLFFQKNGNGPYWGRIHWGHIISDDLLTWKEVETAIDPTNPYDIKGAWSGCVFSDEYLTENKPYIFYTSADYAKASISMAKPLDENLVKWEKSALNPMIPNRPSGLGDDFRDPYVFKNNGNYYMIVGTKKDGVGATTLHTYNQSTNTWSNDGKIFFKSPSTDFGTFWEMPAIVPMGDDKWLFVTTPLGAKNGVESLYWVGSINVDGTFKPYQTTPKEIELGNISKQGYGLLSPSILQKDGKNIIIGIVPDKLNSDYNKQMGWAHLFSLPREWSLDANNNLVQKPAEVVSKLRTGALTYSKSNYILENESASLSPVNGKTLEVEAIFKISGNAGQKFGFVLRKNDTNGINIFYTPATNNLTIDCRDINRWVNDMNYFNGVYSSVLPALPGELIKLNVFLDHSVLDIFINDKWATSVRIFPTDPLADDAEVFAETATEIISLNAWSISKAGWTYMNNMEAESKPEVYFQNGSLHLKNLTEDAFLNIFDLTGQKVFYKSKPEEVSFNNLIPGKIYICQIMTDGKYYTTKIINQYF